MIRYMRYLYSWYKRYGFVTKTSETKDLSFLSWRTGSSAHYKLLGPIAFYREAKELERWRSAAKEYKILAKQFPGNMNLPRQSKQLNQYVNKYQQ